MQQIYRITSMPKRDFNKVTLQLIWNHTSAWVFSCKIAAVLQNTFSENTPGGLFLQKLIYKVKYLTNNKIIIVQVEVSKKREAECNRLRKEMEELNAANDAAAASAKQKFNAQIAEAQDEIENLKKVKAK